MWIEQLIVGSGMKEPRGSVWSCCHPISCCQALELQHLSSPSKPRSKATTTGSRRPILPSPLAIATGTSPSPLAASLATGSLRPIPPPLVVDSTFKFANHPCGRAMASLPLVSAPGVEPLSKHISPTISKADKAGRPPRKIFSKLTAPKLAGCEEHSLVDVQVTKKVRTGAAQEVLNRCFQSHNGFLKQNLNATSYVEQEPAHTGGVSLLLLDIRQDDVFIGRPTGMVVWDEEHLDSKKSNRIVRWNCFNKADHSCEAMNKMQSWIWDNFNMWNHSNNNKDFNSEIFDHAYLMDLKLKRAMSYLAMESWYFDVSCGNV